MDNDKLIRSKDRQQELGEIFTPRHLIDAMLDLIPDQSYLTTPSTTIIDPACGDGRFMEASLDRKFQALAADSITPLVALEVLASIYGVDIDDLNVSEARERQTAAFKRNLAAYAPNIAFDALATPSAVIIQSNIVWGDTLKPDFLVREWRFNAETDEISSKYYLARDVFSPEDTLFSAFPAPQEIMPPRHWGDIT